MPMFPTTNQQREQQQSTFKDALSSLVSVSPYPRPGIQALLNGETVTITGSIDWPGHSPAKEYIDGNGRINYEVTEAFTVIDRQLLPVSDDQMEQVRQSALQQQARLSSSSSSQR